MPSLYN